MKTPSSFSSPSRRGFTLIELLVVIVIIAILAALAVPVTNIVMRRANELRTKATMKDIIVAVGHYRTDYNRFPLSPDQASSAGDTDLAPFLTDGTSSPIINILMANVAAGDTMNPRGIKYVDLPFAKNNQTFGIIDPSGGTGDGAPVQLVDIWALPYMIALDTNYDNRIENPDKQNNDQFISSRAPQNLSASAIMYSFGPDKIQATKDDIVSWR